MSKFQVLAKKLRVIATELDNESNRLASEDVSTETENLELDDLIKIFRQKIQRVKNVPALGKLTVLLSPENFRVRSINDQANLLVNAPEGKIDVLDFITKLRKIKARKNMPGVKALDTLIEWAMNQTPNDVKITLNNLSRIKKVLMDAKEAETK